MDLDDLIFSVEHLKSVTRDAGLQPREIVINPQLSREIADNTPDFRFIAEIPSKGGPPVLCGLLLVEDPEMPLGNILVR